MKRMSMIFAALCLLMPLVSAQAQTYPSKPIRIIAPYPAGGTTDIVARFVAQGLTESLGVPVVVENKAGANGQIGHDYVAKAAPDGYTLLLHHIGQATSASLYRKLPYKPGEAFAGVGLVTDVPMTLVARNDFPPASIGDLIAYWKEHGDKVTLANAGVGSASHLCGMLLMDALDTPATTVPYKGTGPAMTDLMGGQVDLMCDQTTNTSGQIKSGKIKAYAVTSKTPVPSLPDLPTLDASGLPGFEVGIWHGLYAPAGTPPEVIEKLAAALQGALADPKVIERFADLGTEPASKEDATPAALDAQLKGEIARWQPIIEAAGVYAD